MDEAYEDGLSYDLTDLKPKIMAFANNSTNQALQCLKIVQQMKFQGKDIVDLMEKDPIYHPGVTDKNGPEDMRLVFFDVEVYPNLFVVCWKYEGATEVQKMINPPGKDVEPLLGYRLIGFNNRRYDNHILYARFMGYSNEELYKLSQKIINNDRNALFGEAFNISYTDIYDFSSKKQSLKKFQIELGLRHVELDIPWDQPVPKDQWDKVVEYCVNDVETTEATFNARKQDFIARQILAELSGLTVNDTTQKHTARIIFGKDRNPQSQFKYTNLAKDFPGYRFELGKSYYRDEEPGEGGYVYSEPGMYENVAVLDIASMHPTSIEQLNLFGNEYTPKFSDLKNARMAIKHRDYNNARQMLNGKLVPYLEDPAHAEALAYALKIVINTVYGLTSAKFDTPFRDRRNQDNIVAKRGALFMIDLKHAVQAEGFTVAHIKTDSIKIPNATPEICEFVVRFGEKYGYDFEHEATYDKFCLVNDAVYIAKKSDGKWEAVGAQFQHPFVYKKLFSNEPVVFDDFCETKQVQKGALYLDFEHDKPVVPEKKSLKFIGRTGRFVPVREGANGASLYRIVDDKHYAVSGTKGYLWLEADVVEKLGEKAVGNINMSYFERLADEAVKTIQKFGDFEWFIS
jgi:hypothetical protein